MTVPEEFDLDLGDGHWLQYVGWSPDLDIPSNAERFAGIADIERIGAVIYHLTDKTESGMCSGFVHFDTPEIARVVPERHARWEVKSWEPLTLHPSLLCRCGDHGYVRDGRWVKAA